jgi:hypothetical protein
MRNRLILGTVGVFAILAAPIVFANAATHTPPHATSEGHKTPKLGGPIQLIRGISFPALNGCQYSAALRGSIQPAKAPEGKAPEKGKEMAGADQLVIPNVTMAATLSCPDKPDIKVVEHFTTQTPVTVHEFEEGLMRRAAVAVKVGDQVCLFMPDLAVTEKEVEGRSLALMCNVSKVEQKERGGGGGGGKGEEKQQPQQPQQPQQGEEQRREP